MKQDFLQIRIDKELLDLVRHTAAEEDTPVSRFVRKALREKLDRDASVAAGSNEPGIPPIQEPV